MKIFFALLLTGLALGGAMFFLRMPADSAPSRQAAVAARAMHQPALVPSAASPADGKSRSTDSRAARAAERTSLPRQPASIPAPHAADVEDAAPLPPVPPVERRGDRSSPDALGRILQPGAAPRSRVAVFSQSTDLAARGAETIFELAPGMQAPAANARTDPALRLTPEQEAIKDQIADHFIAEIDQAVAAAGSAPEMIGPAWTSAQQRADNRLRQMLGDRAFVQQSAAAAKEALQQR